jgi:hypothetical protein
MGLIDLLTGGGGGPGASPPGGGETISSFLNRAGSLALMLDPMYAQQGGKLLDLAEERRGERIKQTERNQTVDWLVNNKGMDPGQATYLVQNPAALQEWWQKQQPNYQTAQGYGPGGRPETFTWDPNHPNAPRGTIGGEQAAQTHWDSVTLPDGTVERHLFDDSNGQDLTLKARAAVGSGGGGGAGGAGGGGGGPVTQLAPTLHTTVTDDNGVWDVETNKATGDFLRKTLLSPPKSIFKPAGVDPKTGQPLEIETNEATGRPMPGAVPRPTQEAQGLSPDDRAQVESLTRTDQASGVLDPLAKQVADWGTGKAIGGALKGIGGSELNRQLTAAGAAWLTSYLGHAPDATEVARYQDLLPQFRDTPDIAAQRKAARDAAMAARRRTLSPRAQQVYGRGGGGGGGGGGPRARTYNPATGQFE